MHEQMEESFDSFHQRKQHILKELASVTRDRSWKGFPDHPVLPILDFINQLDNAVTTREKVLDTAGQQPPREERTKGGGWLYVSHDPVVLPENDHEMLELLLPGIRTDGQCIDYATGVPPLVYFKYEPFILHVETRTYEHARRILGIALQCGFKHSGVVTTQRRHIVHVRANLKIDAPIANVQGGLLVSPQYIRLCVAAANKKMAENFAQMQRFLDALQVLQEGWGSDASDTAGGHEKVSRDSTSRKDRGGWEDKMERKARKKAEGLLKQQELRAEAAGSEGRCLVDDLEEILVAETVFT